MFVWSIFIIHFLRDVVSLVMDVVLQVILISLIKRYKSRKLELTGRENEAINKAEIRNSIISFILCILSIGMHFLVYLVSMLMINRKKYLFVLKSIYLFCVSFKVFLSEMYFWKYVAYVMACSGIFIGFKYAINIFILAGLNQKFKQKINYILLNKKSE